MCGYRGIEATINVPLPSRSVHSEKQVQELIEAYEKQHQQLYGYLHKGRDIEITAIRVEVVGTMPAPPETTLPLAPRQPKPKETTRIIFQGQKYTTPVFLREDLQAGDELTGPAILCEPTSTIVIDPGFHATITERGDVLIQRSGVGGQRSGREEGQKERRGEGEKWNQLTTDNGQRTTDQPVDPVLLEIFNNLFASIAEQMGAALQRTSFSTNVKERLDFSCAIFDPAGNLVVNAPHIPVHLGAMGETVKRVIADNPELLPGDVIVTNDPYRGGSHLPDVTVVTPVHDDRSGELRFFTASRAHHAEIGGITPGSMPPFSKNLAEEGVLIRNFKVVDAGHSRMNDASRVAARGAVSDPQSRRQSGRRLGSNCRESAGRSRPVAIGAALYMARRVGLHAAHPTSGCEKTRCSRAIP